MVANEKTLPDARDVSMRSLDELAPVNEIEHHKVYYQYLVYERY